VVTGAIAFSFADKAEQAQAVDNGSADQASSGAAYPSVAIVGADDLASAGNVASNNSWPGEIISPKVSQIQPQREGVITNWRVRIGDTVSAHEVLGEISAPPATPELIAMLAERAEALTRAKAQARIADEFAVSERLRLDALQNALSNNVVSGRDLSFSVLESMREKVEATRIAARSFLERAIAGHVGMVSTVTDWRYYRANSLNRQSFGILNQDVSSVQDAYEFSLVKLIDQLKRSADLPIESAQNYFVLAVRLADSSYRGETADEAMISGFQAAVAADQNDFLGMLADYREAQAELADKEAEYKIMISEKNSMVEKDRSMAQAEVGAMEVSYRTVANQITGGLLITAPRAGSVSAIYKKVGDLVDPGMPIAVIAGHGNDDFIVRMRIPNNARKPSVGETLSVVRPGFPQDVRKVKVTGIGISLDETGSYMGDATFVDHADWPVGGSVRVIVPQNSNAPTVKLSSIWWSEDAKPHLWGVSEAGRIFARKITIGRTLGAVVEAYDGIKNGDRYIVNPTPDIHEDALLDDIAPKNGSAGGPARSGGHDAMEGMEM
jgi:multidrug efflux pump subunit AcrA (membrane-fusion protein)